MRKEPPPAADRRFVTVNGARIAYTDSAPDSKALPVFLIHGSPGEIAIFDKLKPKLTDKFRVIVMDLPGFGDSTHNIPDYSFLAHAKYLLGMMDQLHIPRAQLVGFSMGGGVVLSMYDLAPQRVASIVMLSAIGLQRYEMSGNYYVNHFVHGAQVVGLWLLFNAVPHFGALNDFMFSLEYARNFYDSDQRPLEGILAKYKGPMLIIHGTKDPLVNIEAARTHHKMVPQSEMVEYDSNHFMTFMNPDLFVGKLREFLSRVEVEEQGRSGVGAQDGSRTVR